MAAPAAATAPMASTAPERASAATAATGARRHRGLFTIPVTPFADNGALDVDSLRRMVAFCLETGANGVVSPVNVSEFTTLAARERETVFRTIAQEIECAGRRGH